MAKMGRPTIKWDQEFKKPTDKEPTTIWKDLVKMCEFGASELQVSHYIGVSIDACARKIKKETGLSFSEFRAQKKECGIRLKLREVALSLACTKDPAYNPVLIFALKNELGWKDKIETENLNHNVEEETTFNLRWADEAEDALDAEKNSASDKGT